MIDAKKILVVSPNWVGDAVLATPTFRSIRKNYPIGKITCLIKPYLAELFGGSTWFDETIFWPGGKKGYEQQTVLKLLKQVRVGEFDLAILLSNSFRAALTCSLGKISRRVGYDRDGRGVFLTDKLLPDRYNGRFLPVSALKYYLSIADYLGAEVDDFHLELFTEQKFENQIDDLLSHFEIKDNNFALINPGASYGSSKCWPAEYYAEVGDYLAGKFGLNVLVVCSPRETEIAQTVSKKMTHKSFPLINPIIGLGGLKSLVKRSRIMITNDTGPRHFAAAFNIPVVTIFGSTDPRWSETLYVRERQVRIEVDCGPCMKRTCPQKHHKCMKDLKPDRVTSQIDELLSDKNVVVESS